MIGAGALYNVHPHEIVDCKKADEQKMGGYGRRMNPVIGLVPVGAFL